MDLITRDNIKIGDHIAADKNNFVIKNRQNYTLYNLKEWEQMQGGDHWLKCEKAYTDDENAQIRVMDKYKFLKTFENQYVLMPKWYKKGNPPALLKLVYSGVTAKAIASYLWVMGKSDAMSAKHCQAYPIKTYKLVRAN